MPQVTFLLEREELNSKYRKNLIKITIYIFVLSELL